VPAPAVDLPLTLILDPVAAVVAVPNPTIDTGGGSPTTLEPDPVAVAIALPSPTVGLLLAFAPAPVAAAVAVPGPTIEIGPLALAPTSVALLLTVPGPTLSGDQADLLEDSFAEVAVAATGSATTALSQGAYAEVDLR
jgi:hypothetical protein